MGSQSMGSGGTTEQTAMQMIQALRGSNVQAKQQAAAWIKAMMADPGAMRIVGPILASAGMTIMNGEIVDGATRQPVVGASPMVSSSGPGGGLGGMPMSPSGAPPGQWSQALNQIQGPSAPRQDPSMTNANVQKGQNVLMQGQTLGASERGTDQANTAAAGQDGVLGTADDNQGRGVGDSQTPGSEGAYGNDNYAGTFFQNVDPLALDSLTPANAEAIWRTSGGPGGGSLANSAVSQYGSNDFQAAMRLGPLMGDPNQMLSQGDKLQFTDQWMKGAQGGGGQYADPGKILNQALANIGNVSDPQMQQQLIGDALAAIEPYMDPTSYQMLMTRVSRIMDEYLAYGVDKSRPDLSGTLLDQIYGAIGA